MTEPVRRRVTAALVDVVGSSAETERVGNARAGVVIDARLAEVAKAMIAADPTATVTPVVEGGDAILILGDEARAAALFAAAVDHQEAGSVWALKVRIAIGEGAVSEGTQHHAQMLNRIGKLLKVCRPGEVVITDAVRDAVAVEGKAHLLTPAMVDLPGLGPTRYWRRRMPERDEEFYPRAGRALETMEQRLAALERAQHDCDRLSTTTAAAAASTAASVSELRGLVTTLTEAVRVLANRLRPVSWIVFGLVAILLFSLGVTVAVLVQRSIVPIPESAAPPIERPGGRVR